MKSVGIIIIIITKCTSPCRDWFVTLDKWQHCRNIVTHSPSTTTDSATTRQRLRYSVVVRFAAWSTRRPEHSNSRRLRSYALCAVPSLVIWHTLAGRHVNYPAVEPFTVHRPSYSFIAPTNPYSRVGAERASQFFKIPGHGAPLVGTIIEVGIGCSEHGKVINITSTWRRTWGEVSSMTA